MGINMKQKWVVSSPALKLFELFGKAGRLKRQILLKAEQIAPLPSHEVDVWIGSVVEKAIKRTAKLGDGWLASLRTYSRSGKSSYQRL